MMGKVMMSGVAPQMKVPVIPILFDTTFAEKQSDWVEEGGSFNYGDGLYVLEGGSKGTITSGSSVYKKLTIPVIVNDDFIFGFSNCVKSENNNAIGGFTIYLYDANGNRIAKITRNDAWAGNKNQSILVRFTAETDAYSSTQASYNGTNFDFKIICNEGTIAFYMDNALISSANQAFVPVKSIVIEYYSDSNSSYILPEIRINSMKMELVR